MNLQESISTQLKRRINLLDRVIDNLLPNIYPCDYNSSDHFVEGVLDEIRWFLVDVEELKGIERMDIENYILDYKYDELTEYFNERCVVLKNDNLQESIRRILREELLNESNFFRRRVDLDEVKKRLPINAEQVYFETKGYEQFKYELTLRAVEAIMYNEYELGWEDLPEQEEIEFVTEVSNMFDKDIKLLYKIIVGNLTQKYKHHK